MKKWGAVLKAGALVCALVLVTKASAQPNLTPYQPTGWSGAVAVGNSPGGTNYTGTFISSDTLYINWAVANFGNASAINFDIDILVDGTDVAPYFVNFTMNPSTYVFDIDLNIGSLSVGTHTVEVIADLPNDIAE